MNKLAEVTQAMSLNVTRESLAQATDADLDNCESSAIDVRFQDMHHVPRRQLDFWCADSYR